jgi:MYXO-CTERM domain-containing protein
MVWALIGILVKQTADAPSVAACGIAMGAIVLGAAWFHRRKPAAILEATE